MSLKFVPRDPTNNIPSLVQIRDSRRPGDEPLRSSVLININKDKVKHIRSYIFKMPTFLWIYANEEAFGKLTISFARLAWQCKIITFNYFDNIWIYAKPTNLCIIMAVPYSLYKWIYLTYIRWHFKITENIGMEFILPLNAISPGEFPINTSRRDDKYQSKLSYTGRSVWCLSRCYSISQEICTRFCCALLCCGYAIVHNEFIWSIYPYSSGLLCWHWGNR